MKLKTPSARTRPAGRLRRRRSLRDGEKHLGPNQPQAEHRVWSLLLPPGYSSTRR